VRQVSETVGARQERAPVAPHSDRATGIPRPVIREHELIREPLWVVRLLFELEDLDGEVTLLVFEGCDPERVGPLIPKRPGKRLRTSARAVPLLELLALGIDERHDHVNRDLIGLTVQQEVLFSLESELQRVSGTQ